MTTCSMIAFKNLSTLVEPGLEPSNAHGAGTRP